MTVTEVVSGIESYLYPDAPLESVVLKESVYIIDKITSEIVGILVMIIFIGLPLVIALEIAYINFPVISSGCDNLHGRLKGKAARLFGLALRDAKKAVKESHTTAAGQSVNWIYLKKKCVAVFLAVFIVALLIWPGNYLIGIATKIVIGMTSSLGLL